MTDNPNTGFGSFLWYYQMLMNKYNRDLKIKNKLDVKLILLNIVLYIEISMYDSTDNLNVRLYKIDRKFSM